VGVFQPRWSHTHRHGPPGRQLIMRHSSIGFLLLFLGMILDREHRPKTVLVSNVELGWGERRGFNRMQLQILVHRPRVMFLVYDIILDSD